MKTIAIILNGEDLQAERLASALQEADLIIAADGGANYCIRHGVHPHYIIGDLDSLDHEQALTLCDVGVRRTGLATVGDFQKRSMEKVADFVANAFYKKLTKDKDFLTKFQSSNRIVKFKQLY